MQEGRTEGKEGQGRKEVAVVSWGEERNDRRMEGKEGQGRKEVTEVK